MPWPSAFPAEFAFHGWRTPWPPGWPPAPRTYRPMAARWSGLDASRSVQDCYDTRTWRPNAEWLTGLPGSSTVLNVVIAGLFGLLRTADLLAEARTRQVAPAESAQADICQPGQDDRSQTQKGAGHVPVGS